MKFAFKAFVVFFLCLTSSSTSLFANKYTTTICNNQTLNYTPPGSNSSLTYTWTVSYNSNIIGAATQNAAQPSLNQQLKNLSTTLQTVNYYLLNSNDEKDTLEVTINPSSVGGEVIGGTNVCYGSSGGNLILLGNSGLVVRWESSLDSVGWTTINNFANSYTPLNVTKSAWYRAVVSISTCDTTYSKPTKINVTDLSVGGAVNSGVTTVCSGSSVGSITLYGNIGSVIRWESSVDESVWSPFPNTSTSFTPSSLSSSVFFRAVVKNGVCAEAASSSVKITVNSSSVGGNTTGGDTICNGTTSGLLSVVGYTGSILRWQSSIDGNTWNQIINTSDTYISGNLTESNWFRAVVKNGACNEAYAAATFVYVRPLSVGGNVSGSTNICKGSDAGTLMLSANVGRVISWESSPDNNIWTTISNTASSTLAPGVLNETAYFRAVVQNGSCELKASGTALITVTQPSVGGTVTGGTTICSGSSTGLLTLSGNIGNPQKWQSSINGGASWVDIVNTNNTYIVNSLSTNTQYRAVVKNGVCVIDYSSATAVTVDAQSVGGTVNGGGAICKGNTSGLLTLAGNTGVVKRWQSSNDGVVWTDIIHTSTTYTSVPLFVTTYFRAVVQNGICAEVFSSSKKIVVNDSSFAGIVNGASTICAGNIGNALTLSGNVGSVDKWLYSTDAIHWIEIPGTAVTSYTPPVLNASTYYRAIVHNEVCPSDSSAYTKMIVTDLPVLTSSTNPPAICSNELFTYTAESSPVTTFNWTRSIVSGISNPQSSGNSSAKAEEVLTNTTGFPLNVTYRYILTNGTCANTQEVTVKVKPKPMLSGTLTPTAVCSGTMFTYVPVSSTTGTKYTWSRSAVTGISNAAYSGVDSIKEVLINTTHDPVKVTYQITLSADGCMNMQEVSVWVNPTPFLKSSVTPTDVCSGSLFDYSASSETPGVTFKWSRTSVTGISNGAVNNIPQKSIQEILTNTTANPVAVVYKLYLVANGCDNTQDVTVNVKPIPVLNTSLSPSAFCSNSSVYYAANSLTNNVTYSWIREVVPGISNSRAEGVNLHEINETIENTTSSPVAVVYKYLLNSNGCTNTQKVTITINPIPQLISPKSNNFVCSKMDLSYTIISSTSSSSTSYKWERAQIAGISNESSTKNSEKIEETLENNTSNNIVVPYKITMSANGCSNIDSTYFTITPIPSLTSNKIMPDYCSNELINYTATSSSGGLMFHWTRAADAYNSMQSDSRADGLLSERLINNGSTPLVVNYIYTLKNVSSTCESTPQTVSVTIHPKPFLSSTLSPDPVCSNSLFKYTPTSAASPNVSFVWKRAAIAGINGNLPYNSTNAIEEKLVNTTNTAIEVLYEYTLTNTISGCDSIQFLRVWVLPQPKLTSFVGGSCSGEDIKQPLISNQDPVSVTWSRSLISGISNSASSGTTTIIAEKLVNTTSATIPVTYNILFKNDATKCSLDTNIIVYVKPLPYITNLPVNPSICSDDIVTYHYTPTISINNATVSWLRAPANTPNEVSPISNAGTDFISETLINGRNDTIATVKYQFSVEKDGCKNNQEFNLTINPKPVLVRSTQKASVCSGEKYKYIPTSDQSNVKFTWVRNVVSGINNAAGNGIDSIVEILVNTTSFNQTAIYTVRLINELTGCSNTQDSSVIVRATPKIADKGTISICNGNAFVVPYISPNDGAPVGTTYKWSTPEVIATGTVTGATSSLVNPKPFISQKLLNNGNSNAIVTYTITPDNYGCVGSPFKVEVNVPSGEAQSLILSSTLTPAPICSGTFVDYEPTCNTASVAFSWVRYYKDGINNGTATGIDNPKQYNTEKLINNTRSPISTWYVYTLTNGGCTNTEVVNIQVNPSAQPIKSHFDFVCSEVPFYYNPIDTSRYAYTNTTIFNWSRSQVNGISNLASAGSGEITETLVNTTSANIEVLYRYELNTSNNCNSKDSLKVLVYPKPKLNSSKTPVAICSDQIFNYVPTSSTLGTTFRWSRADIPGIQNIASNSVLENPKEVLINTTDSSVFVPYQFTSIANACINTETIVVEVKPVPVINAVNTSICSNNQFIGTPTRAPIGTTYSWGVPISYPAAAVTGATAESAKSFIAQNLINTTTDPAKIVYEVTPTSNGCVGLPFEVTVTVNPIPNASDIVLSPVCSGSTFNYIPSGIQTNTKFSWNAPVITPSNKITGGLAASAQSSVSQRLFNLNTTQSTAEYNVSPIANGCTGSIFKVTVPIDPTPNVPDAVAAICSGETFTVTPNSVPIGTSYKWSLPVQSPVGVIAGATANNFPVVGTIAQALINTTNNLAHVSYQIVPIANNCVGDTFDVVVTVNPSTRLVSTLTPPAVCSGTPFSYIPQSNTSATSFKWDRVIVAGIANQAGSGSDNPNDILINTTSSPKTVKYLYTLKTSANCTQKEEVIVTVNPIPVLSNPIVDTAICSSNKFNYFPASVTKDSSITWTRAAVFGISNISNSGTIGNPGEYLVNTTNTSINVIYNFTVTANGCSSSQLTNVIVKPIPVIADLTKKVCSNENFSIAPVNVPLNTQYTWVSAISSPIGVLTASDGTLQNSIDQKLVNGTNSPSTATYTITPKSDGCEGNPFKLTVTVNPIPVVNDTVLAAVCSSTSLNYRPINIPAATIFSWNNPILKSSNNSLTGWSSLSGQTNIIQNLSSTSLTTDTAIYTVIPSADGCDGRSFRMTVPISSVPIIGNQVLSICSGNSFKFMPANVPAGSTYKWSLPSANPVATINGATAGISVADNYILQTLTNTTLLTSTAIYTVTPLTGNCIGTPFSLTVNVNPYAQLSSNLNPAATCSESMFNYLPSSVTPNTVFQWDRALVSGINNATATGTGNINEKLNNITPNPLIVDYKFTIQSAGSCSSVQHVKVTVNPLPVLSSTFITSPVCSGNIFSYTPTSLTPDSVISWERIEVPGISNSYRTGVGNPSETLVNTTVNSILVAYKFNVASGGCSSSKQIEVLVKPTPVVSSQSVSVCSNVNFNIKPSSIPANTKFSWNAPASNPSGVITGTVGVNASSISQTLSNPSTNTVFAYYTIKPVADGCIGNDFLLEATINPIPVVNDTILQPVCSGTQVTFRPSDIPLSTLLSWGNPELIPVNTITGASIETGQYQLRQRIYLSNTSTGMVNYSITPTAKGCVGNSFNLKIPINPVPQVANTSQTICSGNSFSVRPVEVPSGTAYTWSTPSQIPVGTVSGGNSQSTPVIEIAQQLFNRTNNLSQLVYRVVPFTNVCVGTPFTVTVDVNPIAGLKNTLTPSPICTNTVFNYPAETNTLGTSISWSRVSVGGIANSAASGINNPAEKLVNTTNLPVNVVYKYILATDKGCNNFQDVTVTVKPSPALTSSNSPNAICSGTILNYTPTSNIPGTVFNWSRIIQPSISNNYSVGTFDPNEVLISTGIVPVNVTYDYTLIYNGCSSTYPVKATVNPTPFLSPQQITACSNALFSLSGVTVPTGTLYTWSLPVYVQPGTISGGTSQLNSPSSFSQKLSNLTTANVYANYTITPKTGSCEGVPFTLAVNLNPEPSAPDQTIAKVCANTTFSFKPDNMPVGTLYTWANPISNPVGGLLGGNAESIPQTQISQKLINTNTIVNSAIYTVTPILNNCLGKDFTITVPVDPIPNVPAISYSSCTGSATVIVPDNVPLGTNYTWTLPIVLPYGTVIGAKQQSLPINTFSQTLLNTTNKPAKAIYTVLPSVGNCMGIPFNIEVNVGVKLPLVADQVAEVCSGEEFNATPNGMPRGTKYAWLMPTDNPTTTVFGMNATDDPVDSIKQILFNYTINKGIATYTVTPSNSGCVGNPFKAAVTVLAEPQVVLNGKKMTCRYPIDTLSISFVGTAPWSFSYSLDNGTPFKIGGIVTSPYMHPLPLATPSTNRKISISNVEYSGCINRDDTSNFIQRVNPSPAAGTIRSLNGTYLCNNKSDTLLISASPDLTYQWTLDGNVIAGQTRDSLITGLPGKYNAILKNVYGCIDTITPSFVKEKITKPILQFSYDSYCINTPVKFKNLTNLNTSGKMKWFWDFGNGSTDTSTNPATIYSLGGDHHIQLRGFQEYCANDSITIDTTIAIQIPIPGLIMPSENAYSTVSTPLNARQLNNYRYRWTPSWGIDFPDRPMVSFNYTKTQQYLIELISTGGCITRDTLLVRVYDDTKFVEMIVPKSFSPNGDGVNDILYPYLAGVKKMTSFRIFNRYNQLMFETTNHDQGWNGIANGIAQPMGIYIWIAEGIANDGSVIQRTGQTLLLR